MSFLLSTWLDVTSRTDSFSATFVRARNVFHNVGRDAHLGKYGFGFSWGAFAALLIALILLCAGASRKGSKSGMDGTNGNVSSGRGWRRGRNRRNRAGSFSKVNYEDGRALDHVDA